MVGWLAGEDRIQDYKTMTNKFNGNVWLKDHKTLPIRLNDKGIANVDLIETPRLMSGTEARNDAATLDFNTWGNKVIPVAAKKNPKAITSYKTVFNTLKQLSIDSQKESEIMNNKTYEEMIVKEMVSKCFSKVILNERSGNINPNAKVNLNKKNKNSNKKVKDNGIKNLDKSATTADELDTGEDDLKDVNADVKPINTDEKGLSDVDSDVKPLNTDDDGLSDTNTNADEFDTGDETDKNSSEVDSSEEADDEGDIQVAYTKNPELVTKALKLLLKGSANAFIGMMAAENNASRTILQGGYDMLSKSIESLKGNIKSGKATAESINAETNKFKNNFKEARQRYLNEVAKARKIIDKWRSEDKSAPDFDTLLKGQWKKFNPRDKDWKNLLGVEKNSSQFKTLVKITTSVIKTATATNDSKLIIDTNRAITRIRDQYEDDIEKQIHEISKLEKIIKSKKGATP
jgi:hypothetical protein